MTSPARYHWLLIEDDEDWLKLLGRAADATPLQFYRPARTREEANTAFGQRPFHLASVDQNMPDLAGEPAHSDTGISTVANIFSTRPFVMTTIYTAHPKTFYARAAGRLGETPYKQKSIGRGGPDELSPRQYVEFLRILLQGGTQPGQSDCKPEPGYILWALRQGRQHLPPVLARYCDDAFRTRDLPTDWSRIGTALFNLREHGIYLAWAQAAAIAASLGLKAELQFYFEATSIVAMETNLRQLWIALDKIGHLGSWKPYITERNEDGTWQEPGVAFLGGVQQLREQRNEAAHSAHFSKANFDANAAAILALIDALAYWADHPLMAAPRIHPDDPRRMQFFKIAGQGHFSKADTLAPRAALPGAIVSRERRIYILHETDAFEQRRRERLLIDLYPLVSLKDVAGRSPLPCLLKPSVNGRSLVRVSLEDFDEVQIPLDGEERAALRTRFGYG